MISQARLDPFRPHVLVWATIACMVVAAAFLAGRTHAPRASAAVSVRLTGSFPRLQRAGHAVHLSVHLRSELKWPWVALLDLNGIQQWHIAGVGFDRYGAPIHPAVGMCTAGDNWPDIMAVWTTGEIYLEMPAADCTVTLSVTPRRAGFYPLTVTVLQRDVAERDGHAAISWGDYVAPVRLTGVRAIPGVRLAWNVRVVRRST